MSLNIVFTSVRRCSKERLSLRRLFGLLKDFNGTTDQIDIYLKSSKQDLANFFLSLSFFMRIDSTQDLTLILS